MLSYKILEGASGPDLEYKVNTALDDGFIPVGGPFMQGGYYLQAVIKADKTVNQPKDTGVGVTVGANLKRQFNNRR
jgi:Domain of unknown function (DUF1737)